MESIESMSLGHAAFLIAVFSTIIVSLISCAKRPAGKFWFLVAALVVPFLLANGLYWSAAWQAKQARGPAAFGDYEAWAFVAIIPCFLAGAIPSVLAVLFVRLFVRKVAENEHQGLRPK